MSDNIQRNQLRFWLHGMINNIRKKQEQLAIGSIGTVAIEDALEGAEEQLSEAWREICADIEFNKQ